MKKLSLFISIPQAREKDACQAGIEFALKLRLPKKRPFNIMRLLTVEGIHHFIWTLAFLIDDTPEISRVRSKILYDSLLELEPIYRQEYPKCSAIRNFLIAIRDNKGIENKRKAYQTINLERPQDKYYLKFMNMAVYYGNNSPDYDDLNRVIRFSARALAEYNVSQREFYSLRKGINSKIYEVEYKKAVKRHIEIIKKYLK